MRLLSTLLVLLIGLSSLYAQTSLKGKILDQNDGEGLPFASVALKQGDHIIDGRNTDVDGNYFFVNINPGSYDLEVSYTGYATQKVMGVLIKAGQINVVDVKMSGGVQLDEVVVTGYKVPLVSHDNTTMSQVVTLNKRQARKQRKARKKQQLPTRNVSSIATTAPGPNNSNEGAVNIRGSRANATNYYVDGIRVQGNLVPETLEVKAKKEIRQTKVTSAMTVAGRNPEPEPESNEQYNEIKENAFISTDKEAISTLSTDVDRAAYANVRGLINAGLEVPKDAVRIEEMINYFRYSDPYPKEGDPVAARTELAACPWNPDHQLLRIGVRAKGMNKATAPASNIVFLVDVSGSMNQANKLPMVTKALKMLASNLRQEDKVSIVVYAGAAGLALPPTSGANTQKITETLDKLRAGGSTAGGKGIQLAYKTARENFIEGGNNRVVLVTDGDFNVGTSSQEGLVGLIEKERESGVFLTVIGCGRGNLQDGKMQELADRGNGNHGYLDSYAEARKLLIDEFGGTVYTVAKDVKLQLEFNTDQVAGYRLIGYENRLLNTEDFDDDTKDAAEMGAGHVVTVLYEIIPNENGNKRSNEGIGELRLRYKQPGGDTSEKITWPISDKMTDFEKAGADLRWAAAVAEFGLLLRDSDYKGRANWSSCAKHVEAALGPDPFGYRKEMLTLVKASSAR